MVLRYRSKSPARAITKPRMMESVSSLSFMRRIARVSWYPTIKEAAILGGGLSSVEGYYLLAVAGGPHRAEAIATVDRLVTTRPEGNHSILATLSANCLVHLSG